MRLRSKLAIKCAKMTSSLIKKMNRGSGVTLPGYVARLIDPNILKEMAGQVRGKIIVTMGTNGKTTTNAILCRALESEGKKLLRTPVGDKFICDIMFRKGYNLGGEQSGHFIVYPAATTGDGLLSSIFFNASW